MCAGGFLQHYLNLSVSAVCDRESLSEETKEAKEKLCKVFLEFVIATFASVSKDHVDEEESLLVMHALSVPPFSTQFTFRCSSAARRTAWLPSTRTC